MRKKFYRLLGVVILLLLVFGCSQSSVKLGYRAMAQENYSLAKTHFEQTLKQDPDNFKAQRGLGQVYYQMKDYTQAIEYLEMARVQHPSDGLTNLYLGLVKEAQADFDGAERVYRRYLLSDKKSKTAHQIQGRLLYVNNQKVRQQVKQALEFEVTQTSIDINADAIGVLPFVLESGVSDSLQPLANGLASAVWYDLSKVSSIKLVERMQLKYLREELELRERGFSAAELSPRLGRLVRAGYLVDGTLSFPGENHVSVSSGITNTVDSSHSIAIISDEQFSRIITLQKQVTFAIIDSLGIVLTPAERNEIEKIPTVSYRAFLAYSNGIDQLDRGNYELANNYFNQAVAIDPGFEQAVSLQEESSMLLESGGTIDEFESTVVTTFGTGMETGVESTEDVLDVTALPEDERSTDDPVIETGTVTLGGSIR